MSCAQTYSILAFSFNNRFVLLLDHVESKCCNREIREICFSDFYSCCFDNECQFFAFINVDTVLFNFNSHFDKHFRVLPFFLYLGRDSEFDF